LEQFEPPGLGIHEEEDDVDGFAEGSCFGAGVVGGGDGGCGGGVECYAVYGGVIFVPVAVRIAGLGSRSGGGGCLGCGCGC